MKLRHVFALVPDCHIAGWRYAEVWRRHFYGGMEQAGVAVTRPIGLDFSWARPPQNFDPVSAAAARAQTSAALRAQILPPHGAAPQAVISCCFSHDVEPDLVDRVRAAGIPWINFFCDSLYAFDRVADLAARTSLNWFVESAAEARYRALGVPILRAPYALNPEALPDVKGEKSTRDLLFIGAVDPNRLRAVARLRLAGVDLHVRGWGWQDVLQPKPIRLRTPSTLVKWAGRTALRALLDRRIGGFLELDQLLAELRQSAMVLGLNEGGLGTTARSYLKLRDLEFPGMGCCCLSQHHADLSEILEPGREVLTFHTAQEAARLARDLARDPTKCREIGQRARARVLREHTWTARLPMLESRL